MYLKTSKSQDFTTKNSEEVGFATLEGNIGFYAGGTFLKIVTQNVIFSCLIIFELFVLLGTLPIESLGDRLCY